MCVPIGALPSIQMRLMYVLGVDKGGLRVINIELELSIALRNANELSVNRGYTVRADPRVRSQRGKTVCLTKNYMHSGEIVKFDYTESRKLCFTVSLLSFLYFFWCVNARSSFPVICKLEVNWAELAMRGKNRIQKITAFVSALRCNFNGVFVNAVC